MPERMLDRMSEYMPERMSNTVEGQYSSLCTLNIYIYIHYQVQQNNLSGWEPAEVK